MSGTSIDANQIIGDAEATGQSYLTTWLETTKKEISDSDEKLLALMGRLVNNPLSANKVTEEMIAIFREASSGASDGSDLAEDMTAWNEMSRDISRHLGRNAPLDHFLQELQLRSKEPSPKPRTVRLMTIHGAKGKEFESVYLIGLAEDILPSFQSVKKGNASPEMEEERRNCFVAITRTKECLILSRAERYRGWVKLPSRFLVEMGFAAPEE
jgi:DNA helicase-2/ATP-dependent DNA helicase PcrA